MTHIRAAYRTFIFLSATLGLYAIWWVAHFFVRKKINWRQAIFGWWTASFVRISKMRVEVVGEPPRPPFFLVANHLSYTDIGALRYAAKGVFVAKAEVKGWPVAGPIVRDMGTVFIDRRNRRDIPRAGKEILERLEQGEGVIVFPEGTSTKGETVLPFNSSFLQFAAEGDVPVSYASLSYRTDEGLPPASNYVCWWEDISFFAHLWRLFKLPRYTAIVTFGEEPITNHDRKALAAELRQRVADNFEPVL
jgi:1-acyl-sn-glycerol-3-phosphate acyltransferase